MSFSSLNATFGPPPLSSSNLSNSSLHPLLINCLWTSAGTLIFTSFTITTFLFFLPLYILVLCMGIQRWRRQRSVHGGRLMSHHDLITYHMVTVELIAVLGLVFYSYGISMENMTITVLGTYVFSFIFPGQSLFHCLTCMEHYLAVVHPNTYMRARETGGVRIRKISIGCDWLLCFGLMAVRTLYPHSFPTIPFLCLLGFSIIVELFCSLSVLHVLIRPGPGEAGRDRDQSKHRAFHIIMAILGVQLLRFVGFFLCVGVSFLLLLSKDVCVLLRSGIWLTLPSSLVQPLLFLHRAGKLACYGQSNESG